MYFYYISQQMRSIKYNFWQVSNSYMCHHKGVYWNNTMQSSLPIQVLIALTGIIKILELYDSEHLQVQAHSHLYLSGICIHTSAMSYIIPFGFILPNRIYFTCCNWMLSWDHTDADVCINTQYKWLPVCSWRGSLSLSFITLISQH
jgi:hypothetical protein